MTKVFDIPCLWALIAVVGVAASCTMNKDAAVPLVRVHAEKDLQCASAQIQVTAMVGGRYRASGCGRTAIYDSACEGLQCRVTNADEEAPAWRDRPEPDSPDFTR